jgi:hypothetical protein
MQRRILSRAQPVSKPCPELVEGERTVQGRAAPNSGEHCPLPSMRALSLSKEHGPGNPLRTLRGVGTLFWFPRLRGCAGRPRIGQLLQLAVVAQEVEGDVED